MYELSSIKACLAVSTATEHSANCFFAVSNVIDTSRLKNDDSLFAIDLLGMTKVNMSFDESSPSISCNNEHTSGFWTPQFEK
jgi:hypothetical protein